MTAARAPELPLVSIVVPSFNQGSFIGDAIDSVLAQDYPSIEVVVVDGCSSDDTVDVLHRYDGDDRVRWTSEPDRGQSDAINKGWRWSRGEILSWLCADDGLYPHAVSTIVEAFGARPDAGLVYGRGDLVDLHGAVLDSSPLGARDAESLVRDTNFICQPAAFATRAAIDTVGHVDDGLSYAMDWDLFIRIARAFPFVHLPEVLAWVRIHDDTKSQRGGRQRFQEVVEVLRRYSDTRYPPSYFVFAIGTYVPIARGLIDRLPTPAARRGSEWLDTATQAITTRLRRRIGEDRGWYADGWAAPELQQTLPADGSRLRIRGRVPEEYDDLRGQELRVVCDGEILATEAVEGEFTLDLPLDEATDPTARRILIEASRSFVPHRSKINQDRRRLSFYLMELDASRC